MKRAAVILLCALLLPTAAWASGIDITNQNGTVNITSAGIVSSGSQLKSFNGITAAAEHALGSVSFSTGAFTSGGIFTGGTLSATGSTFDIVGVGLWAKKLTGVSTTPVALFIGSFVGPITWTVVSHTGMYNYVFALSGTIQGSLWTGRYVTGTTTQTIYLYQNQWAIDHQGGIHFGNTQLPAVPEPGTLGMLGTGLIAVAGTMRRKLFGS